jgi:DNA-binding protein HU-beta
VATSRIAAIRPRLNSHEIRCKSAHRLIEQTLREGKTVTFPGFGTFYTRERQAGQVRDVRTGEMRTYAARRVAAFRVGDVLKRAVRGERRRGRPRRNQDEQ